MKKYAILLQIWILYLPMTNLHAQCDITTSCSTCPSSSTITPETCAGACNGKIVVSISNGWYNIYPTISYASNSSSPTIVGSGSPFPTTWTMSNLCPGTYCIILNNSCWQYSVCPIITAVVGRGPRCSTRSGDINDPTTWNNQQPTTTDKVKVQSPHVVTLNNSSSSVGSISVGGGGSLGGRGSINTFLGIATRNEGSISPGASPGRLQINSDFETTGDINIEIGGTTVETEYDQLVIGGAATLNGTLNVSLYDNGSGIFVPEVGQSFTIFDAISLTGTFNTVNLPSLPSGRTWTTLYNPPEGTVTLTVNAVLPVELLSFKATPKNQMIQLDWQTALEQNADLFDIERSADGQYFEKIASVKAVNKANIYNFVDEHPLSNLSYYRLKQMDTNHKFTYSNTISVVFSKTKTLKVYPNPSTNDFTIELPLAEKKLSIAVFDATGKLVFKENTEGGRFLKIATNNWLSGIYILKINNQNNCWTERLTKF